MQEHYYCFWRVIKPKVLKLIKRVFEDYARFTVKPLKSYGVTLEIPRRIFELNDGIGCFAGNLMFLRVHHDSNVEDVTDIIFFKGVRFGSIMLNSRF